MNTLPVCRTNPHAPLEGTAARVMAPVLLVNLNTLRAVAALAVVYSHITSDAGLNLPLSIGTRGVDIFFVISGFIIAYIGSRHADRFFIRRLIRIVPFYWAATVALFGVVLVAPHLLRSTQPDLAQLLCSLLFIPRETSYAGMFPTLVLGWSLNYEMYFYVVFALALLVSRRLAPVLCGGAIAAVWLAIAASGTLHPSLQFYGRSLVFEFVFGIVIFYLLMAAERHRAALQAVAGGRAVALLVLAAALVAIFFIEARQGFGLPRQISAGVPAFFIVLAAILLERIHRVTINSRVLFLLGEASYILYLIHPYIVFGVLRTALRGYRPGLPATVAIIAALMTLSSVIAVAIHVYLEKPAMRFLRRRVLGEGLPHARHPLTAAPVMAPRVAAQAGEIAGTGEAGVDG